MLFPLGDDNSGRRTTPWIVWGLVAANVAVFLGQVAIGDALTNAWAAVPFEIVHNTDLVRPIRIEFGQHVATLQHYPGPVPIQLTLLTSIFMHGSIMHIAGNMLYLWIFGDQIEDLLGHWTFLGFYLVCGLVASAAHIATDVNSPIPTLGASGAIAGVLGAYLVKYPTNRVRVLMIRVITDVPAVIVLGFWIVIQVISQATMGAGTGVAYMAHIGGFVAGVVLVFVLARRGNRQAPARAR